MIRGGQMTAALYENPIIRALFTADPSAHVWTDGKLWLYPSHDRDNAQWWDMDDWHVFSSPDLVAWTDHGVCLSLADIPYAKKFAWAPDCAYRNGKYYFYFPVSSDAEFGNTNCIGVGVGDLPQGPFVPQPKPLIIGYPRGFDPAVFIDDDGTAYLYCGQRTACVARLKASMTELDEELRTIAGVDRFFEGIWMSKRAGVYYLLYSVGQELWYAMGDNPYGPFECKGAVLHATGCDTTHGSFVEFKDRWYLFYHTCEFSHDNFKRSVCCDPIVFNADGTVRCVRRSAGTQDCR